MTGSIIVKVKRSVRLAYLVSHPIQYQVPLLRRIAAEPDIDLTVLYGSDFSVRGYKDDGFGVEVIMDAGHQPGGVVAGHRHAAWRRDDGFGGADL